MIIVNPRASRAKKAAQTIEEQLGIYVSIAQQPEQVRNMLKISPGQTVFVGGDGTFNNAVNEYMALPEKSRKRLTLGFFPAGKANDLPKELGTQTLDDVLSGQVKEIDLVEVNGKFFVTGGGVGLPTQVVKDVFDNPALSARLKEQVYPYQVLRNIIRGYQHPNSNGSEYMAIAVMNQPTIGRKFHLCPDAQIDDGQVDIAYIHRPSSKFGELKTILDITKRRHAAEFSRTEKIVIELEEETWFMGDGELLCYDKRFDITVHPKALRVLSQGYNHHRRTHDRDPSNDS